MTRTHIDSGVQVVLYNVVAGRNRFLGVPRDIAIRLSAFHRAICVFVGRPSVRGNDEFIRYIMQQSLEYELTVLRSLLDRGMLEYAEAGAGKV